MPDYNQLLYDIEVHSVEGIKKYFEEGGNPNEVHNCIPLFRTMVEMYTRTPRFKNCIKAFTDAGLVFEDQALLAVLSDNAEKLKEIIARNPQALSNTYNAFNNTYTPLTGATLLHHCAEYNSVNCATVLVDNGADVDARAWLDAHGFGGHTPVFHTVNQNSNNSAGMMHFLLAHGADLSVSVKGLIWGKGYEWETFIPSVNPISYAMMGLLPQMHRKEKTVAETVRLLMKHRYQVDYSSSKYSLCVFKQVIIDWVDFIQG